MFEVLDALLVARCGACPVRASALVVAGVVALGARLAVA